MRIDWEHETFESGLELWTTAFRGFAVEIRKDPGRVEFFVKIDAGGEPMWERAEQNVSLAMQNALRWINSYWDVLEDGPNVTYQVMDIRDEMFAQEAERIPPPVDEPPC